MEIDAKKALDLPCLTKAGKGRIAVLCGKKLKTACTRVSFPSPALPQNTQQLLVWLNSELTGHVPMMPKCAQLSRFEWICMGIPQF